MPAARPDDDAFAVWLCVRAECSGRGVEYVFEPLAKRMERPLLRRGVGPSIDRQRGRVVGDALSPDRLKKLFNKAQRLMKADSVLQAKMTSHAAQLSAALAQGPGSYLFPWRVRSGDAAKVDTWLVAQFCPREERLTFYAAHPISLALCEADDPNGPFTTLVG